jgi:hypothetical protein
MCHNIIYLLFSRIVSNLESNLVFQTFEILELVLKRVLMGVFGCQLSAKI